MCLYLTANMIQLVNLFSFDKAVPDVINAKMSTNLGPSCNWIIPNITQLIRLRKAFKDRFNRSCIIQVCRPAKFTPFLQKYRISKKESSQCHCNKKTTSLIFNSHFLLKCVHCSIYLNKSVPLRVSQLFIDQL